MQMVAQRLARIFRAVHAPPLEFRDRQVNEFIELAGQIRLH